MFRFDNEYLLQTSNMTPHSAIIFFAIVLGMVLGAMAKDQWNKR